MSSQAGVICVVGEGCRRGVIKILASREADTSDTPIIAGTNSMHIIEYSDLWGANVEYVRHEIPAFLAGTAWRWDFINGNQTSDEAFAEGLASDAWVKGKLDRYVRVGSERRLVLNITPDTDGNAAYTGLIQSTNRGAMETTAQYLGLEGYSEVAQGEDPQPMYYVKYDGLDAVPWTPLGKKIHIILNGCTVWHWTWVSERSAATQYDCSVHWQGYVKSNKPRLGLDVRKRVVADVVTEYTEHTEEAE